MNKLITIAVTGLILSQTAYAADKYNLKDPTERRALQQALSLEYTRSNVDRVIRSLERAVQNKAPYAQKAQAALPALKDLSNSLNDN